MAGLTTEGLIIKLAPEIKANVEAQLKAAFGSKINLDDANSTLQKTLGPLYAELEEPWLILKLLYDGFDLNAAEGALLDVGGALTGNVRKPASKSSVVVTVTGTEGTIIPDNWVRTVSTTGARFLANNVGTTYTIPASGSIDVPFLSEELGPIAAAAGTLTEGASLTGVTGTTNAVDATLGSEIESDAVFRQRILDDIQSGGKATINAIQQAVEDVPTVVSAKVFVNKLSYEVGGIPAHGIQVFVQSNPATGDEQDIIDAMGLSVGATTQTVGDESGTWTAGNGQTYDFFFQRTTTIRTYVTVELNATDVNFPIDGLAQITNSIVAYGAGLGISDDVLFNYVSGAVTGVAGITDFTIKIGLVAPGTGTANIPFSDIELATISSGDVTINDNR